MLALFARPIPGMLHEDDNEAPVTVIGLERAPNFGVDRGELNALVVDGDGLLHRVAPESVDFTGFVPDHENNVEAMKARRGL